MAEAFFYALGHGIGKVTVSARERPSRNIDCWNVEEWKIGRMENCWVYLIFIVAAPPYVGARNRRFAVQLWPLIPLPKHGFKTAKTRPNTASQAGTYAATEY